MHQINYRVWCYLVKNQWLRSVDANIGFIVLIDCFKTLLSDLCNDYSAVLKAQTWCLIEQCSRFLFLSVHRPRISTILKGITQIYLPYLPLFPSLLEALMPSRLAFVITNKSYLLLFIPDICHFFYTHTFWDLKILHPKVCKFTTK